MSLKCQQALAYALIGSNLALAILASGCGGGGGGNSGRTSTTSVVISISPMTASVTTGGTTQFTATVSGSSNQAVSWYANGVLNGNGTAGLVSTSGLYTAPATVPNPTSVTVSATSQADPTKSASASVSLSYPAPTIQTITPNSVPVGSAKTLLAVMGSGLTPATTISLDSNALPTSFVSATEVTATVPTSNQTTAGTHNVSVSNPSPGGGSSTVVSFTVTNLLPTLGSVLPSTIQVGSDTTRVTLTGSSFLASTTASLNSNAVPTTYVSSTELVSTIDASNFDTAGTLTVNVTNPSPGGGPSNQLAVNVIPIGVSDDYYPTAPQVTDPSPEALAYAIGSTAAQRQSNLRIRPASEAALVGRSHAAPKPEDSSNQTACTFSFPGSGFSGECIGGVPWMSQVPPGDAYSWGPTGTANCGPASLAMVEGFYEGIQSFTDDDGTSTPALCESAPNTNAQCQIIRILNYAESSSGNVDAPKSTWPCPLQVTDANGIYYGPQKLFTCQNGFALDQLGWIAANQSGFSYQFSNPGSVSDAVSMTEFLAPLRTQLQSGHPTIVRVFAKMIPSNVSHYMVLVGMDDNDTDDGLVYLNDPGRGWAYVGKAEYSAYTKAQFRTAWNDSSNSRQYLVVYPSNSIVPPSIVQGTTQVPGGEVGVSFGATFDAQFGTQPYQWSVLEGTSALPSGLTLDKDTGTLSGTPQVAGLFSFTLHVTDSTQALADASMSITVGQNPVPLTVTSPAQLPVGKAGSPYSAVLAAAGSTAPYSWSVPGGVVPLGLNLNSNGMITGLPTGPTSGTAFTVQVADSSTPSKAATKSMQLTVSEEQLSPQIVSLAATPNPVSPNGSASLSCLGFDPNGEALSYVWNITGGAIAGSGTNVTWTAPLQPGGYGATCSVSDSGGGSVSQVIPLSVSGAGLSASISPGTGVATTTNFTVTGSGATANGGVTATITFPNGSTATANTNANASGQFTFGPFTESTVGTYTEVDSDNKTGAQSNVVVWTVTPTGIVNVVPSNWGPVFTVGDPAATIGFYITNQSGGTLTGTITASTNTGGQWLTVNGHPSDNWVAPGTEEITANPAGLSAGTYSGMLTITSPNPPSTVTVPVTMTIYNALQITTSSLPDAVSGQQYSVQLHASGGTGTGFTWSLVSGTLPVGISFPPSGLLSGTAGSLSGSTTETLKVAVQDSIGHQAIGTFSLLWRQALVILPYSPSNFQFAVGSPGSITLQAAGGTPPYTWSATGMPPGLSIVASSGLVTGTPTQAGSFTANVTVTDSGALSTTSPVTFSVVLTPLTVTTATLPSGIVGVAYTQFVNAQGGSQSGYTWTIQGSLPPGLVSGNPQGCNTTCGLEISGTPTQGGAYTFTAQVTDSLNDTARQSLTIVINTATPPQITTTTLSLAIIGQPYAFTFTATGGAGGYQWSIVGNGPDPGVQLSTTGLLSGSGTVSNDCASGPDYWYSSGSSISFQVQVKDSSGQASVHAFCLPEYYATPQISSLTPPYLTIDGQQHTVTVNGTGFRNNAYLYDGGTISTAYLSGQALTFTLSPSTTAGFTAGPSGPFFDDGTTQLWTVQPFSYISNQVNLTIYDPPPVVSSVTPVLNNSKQPCTANLNCQLVVNGGGLVFDTSYTIVETGQHLIVASNPGTPIPWNTVTTSAFSVSSAGTYTLSVTNPSQVRGGNATATATFTVGH